MGVDDYEHLTGGGTVRDSLLMETEVEFVPVVSHELGKVAAL